MFLITGCLSQVALLGWTLLGVVPLRAVARAEDFWVLPRRAPGALKVLLTAFQRRVPPPPQPGGVKTFLQLSGRAEEALRARGERTPPPRDPEEGRACGVEIRRRSRGEGCLPVPETEPPPLGLSEGGEERSTRGNPVPPMRDRPAKPLRALTGSLLFSGTALTTFAHFYILDAQGAALGVGGRGRSPIEF